MVIRSPCTHIPSACGRLLYTCMVRRDCLGTPTHFAARERREGAVRCHGRVHACRVCAGSWRRMEAHGGAWRVTHVLRSGPRALRVVVAQRLAAAAAQLEPPRRALQLALLERRELQRLAAGGLQPGRVLLTGVAPRRAHLALGGGDQHPAAAHAGGRGVRGGPRGWLRGETEREKGGACVRAAGPAGHTAHRTHRHTKG